MPGNEKTLPTEMLDAFCGREPRSGAWLRAAGVPRQVLFGGGSGNLPLFRNATKLMRGEPGMVQWWMEYFSASRDGFMGKELTSPYSYGDWIPLCVAVVSSWARGTGETALLAAADEWLLAFWVLTAKYRAPDGTVARCGMRGAGEHTPQPGPGAMRELVAEMALYDGPDADLLGAWCSREGAVACRALLPNGSGKAPVLHVAGGGAGARAVAGWDRANYSKPERALWLSVAEEVRQSAAPVRSVLARGADPLTLWTGHKLVVRLAIVRTIDLVAVWMDRNVNSNTPPILAAVWRRGGGWSYLPAHGGGRRVRQQMDHAVCQRLIDDLIYTGDKFPSGQIALPFNTPPAQFVSRAEEPPTAPPTAHEDEGEDDSNATPPRRSWWRKFLDWIDRI